MGNEQSSLSGLVLDQKSVEVTDFWSHHTANIISGNPVTVLIGEPLIGGPLWVNQTPLEKVAKNLMVYRHPCILKYISSWHKNSKFYLAVENVKPLTQVLPTLSTLQICVGLHSVLKALCFLHDKASTSHNNVSLSAIYVTSDGNWKLGGMEYLSRFVDTTEEYLTKTRVHRYNKSLDPNENKIVKGGRYELIDSYAYSVLVNDVLANVKDDEIVCLETFKDFCKNDLQQATFTSRPKLSTLLNHQFFNHDFITIHSFLTELPLKDDVEKTEFFTTLISRIKIFNEVVVLKQLGALLLSRMVVLDKTAQQKVLPFILTPKCDANSEGLFSMENFKTYLVPKILHMFCVRDAQIRLFLLDYFLSYIKCFSSEQLQLQLLPELLVGVKDTNDQLVSATLRALAELVPILGANVVIGGRRAKLFNDGRPTQLAPKRMRRTSSKPVQENNTCTEITSQLVTTRALPERPSPDGEEGETSTEDAEPIEEDFDNWEDWDVNTENPAISLDPEINASNVTKLDVNLEGKFKHKKKSLPDLLELDIKTQILGKSEDIDFFQDMEPVIETSTKYLAITDTVITNDINKLNLNVVESDNLEEGWGDDIDLD